MQTQYELTTLIAQTNPIEFGFDNTSRSAYRNILLTFSTYLGYHNQESKMTTWVSVEVLMEKSHAKKKTVTDMLHYLCDNGVLSIKKDRYKGATFLHNHYTWLGFRQPVVMFSEWLALKKAKTPYVKSESVVTQTPLEPLQQAPRPYEIKPSDSTFEDDMLATEALVKPRGSIISSEQPLQGLSLESFVSGRVFLDYTDFKTMFQRVGNLSSNLSVTAQKRYERHINEFTEEIPF